MAWQPLSSDGHVVSDSYRKCEITIRSLVSSKGQDTISCDRCLQFQASLLNCAPGNQAGMYFTANGELEKIESDYWYEDLLQGKVFTR
jgi:hypothetical protein